MDISEDFLAQLEELEQIEERTAGETRFTNTKKKSGPAW